MSETPRDQRALWREVSRSFEELGEALRVHLSPDAARTPSDPTGDRDWVGPTGGSSGGSAGPADQGWVGPTRAPEPAGPADHPADAATSAAGEARADSGTAASADPGTAASDEAAAGLGDDDWAAPGAGRTAAPGAGSAAAGEGGDWVGPTDADDTAVAGPASGAESAPWADPASGSPGGPGEGAGGSDSDWLGATRPGAGGGDGDPWAAATAGDAPPPRSTASGSGRAGSAGSADTGSAGSGDAGGGSAGTGWHSRGWRDWSGSSGGRFATPADWESARDSVRDVGRSAQRLATQVGDAARDPHVHETAQRAARTLGDAIVTTVEDLATDLRNRMRNPRWSDTSTPGPTERPPVAPIEDDPDEKY